MNRPPPSATASAPRLRIRRPHRALASPCTLPRSTVFDPLDEAPDKVLHKLYSNLERLKRDGDTLASEVHKRLRLIVAGGDGTAGWLLGVVSDLKLAHPPPVATVSLGTGNNLPYSFGWGKRNPGTDRESVISFLQLVKEAREINIDSWHTVMRMKCPKRSPCDPIAPSDLPQSLHAFHRVPKTDHEDMEYSYTYRGGFWNYFSMENILEAGMHTRVVLSLFKPSNVTARGH